MSTVTVSERQERLARELVAQTPDPRFTAIGEETTVEVPAELGILLREVLRRVAEGGSLTLKSLPSELTTTVAAGELGVSRPTLVRMIRDGEIAAHKVGSHHRLKLADVLEFRRARLERQRAAFEELRQLEDQHGVE
ncbi:excisionase family DNA-binding protein [Phytoactinopolyspora mesophila]|uniref:Excisionase family DNA-binding protein n=1 Tax=Phytoactinopolyspora mesophila TaxID=2650750 RepID=A0A7K3LZQ5_9ACTN|nr:helix-turn-helix domain-containing protein [Phytoactinopolyspora mesophila]NDL56287.1 excisionase family DNA-binding protein [Phytoactinopolyspora mesophila]